MRMIRELRQGEKGFMVEAAIAIALLGIIAISFYGALATLYITGYVSSKRSIALNLSQKQLESIVHWTTQVYKPMGGYDRINTDTSSPDCAVPVEDELGNAMDYTPYTIVFTETQLINPNTGDSSPDVGMQRIKITIDRIGQSGIITLTGYKVQVQ